MILFLLVGRQNGGHATSFHPWSLVDFGHILEFLDEPAKDVHPLILINNVATPELNPGFDLVSILQERPRVLRFEVKIVRVRMRSETHLFHLDVL